MVDSVSRDQKMLGLNPTWRWTFASFKSECSHMLFDRGQLEKMLSFASRGEPRLMCREFAEKALHQQLLGYLFLKTATSVHPDPYFILAFSLIHMMTNHRFDAYYQRKGSPRFYRKPHSFPGGCEPSTFHQTSQLNMRECLSRKHF